MTLSIHTQGLTRRFAGGFGVSDLDLAVSACAVYGFLGPNGAGKTTTIRLLLGLLQPDRGTIHLHGQTLDRQHRQALAQVGALVESPSLYPHLTGRQNLDVTRRLLTVPVSRIDEVLAITAMREAVDRKVRDYSLVAMALLAMTLMTLLLLLIVLGGGLLGGPPPWAFLLSRIPAIFAATLLIIALHNWIAIRWRSFTVAVSIGMTATVAGFLIGQSKSFGHRYPWSRPVQVLAGDGERLEYAVLVGLLGGMVVAALGLWDFLHREMG